MLFAFCTTPTFAPMMKSYAGTKTTGTKLKLFLLVFFTAKHSH